MSVQLTEHAGLRVLAPGHGRPARRAALLFRVGAADEPVLRRGWTHLFEHWALDEPGPTGAVRQFADAVNGSTSPQFLEFDLAADPQRLPAALDTLLGRMVNPSLDGIDHDVAVLGHEQRHRTPSWFSAHLTMRYGVAGPGVISTHELGVDHIEPDALRAWLAPRLVAENAVLCLDGELAGELTVRLPAGCARPPQIDWQVPVPGVRGLAGGVVISGELPTGPTGELAARVLARRLQRWLREPLVPAAAHRSLSMAQLPITVDADLCAAAWSSPADASFDLVELVGLLDELAAGRFDADELRAVRQLLWVDRQSLGDSFGTLLEAAQELLQTGRLPDASAEPVSDDELAAALTRFRATLLICGPMPAGEPPAGFAAAEPPAWSLGEVRSRWRPSAVWTHGPAELLVSAVGAELQWQADAVRIRFADVVGVRATADGLLSIIDRHGSALTIDPVAWADGPQLVRALLGQIDPRLVVWLPAREFSKIPKAPARQSLVERFRNDVLPRWLASDR